MAKAEVTLICSDCGASYIRTKICANRKDANSWESWVQTHSRGDVCADCYRRRQRAAAQQKADTMEASDELPVLIGSEKQISWARTIRANIIEKVNQYMDGHKPTDNYTEFRKWLVGQNKASWWIDNRGIQYDSPYTAANKLAAMWWPQSKNAEDNTGESL